jgi:hypothetical protein
MGFWIVVLLCIIAQWMATRARAKAQHGIELLQPLFFRSENVIRQKASTVRLSPGTRFDQVRPSSLLVRQHRQNKKGQTDATDIRAHE